MSVLAVLALHPKILNYTQIFSNSKLACKTSGAGLKKKAETKEMLSATADS